MTEITIEDLEHYRGWDNDVKSIDAQISAEYSHLPTTGREQTGSRSTMPGDPTAHKAARIESLRRRQSALISKMLMVETWVNKCDDAELASVCRYHYILGYSWKKTAWILYNNGNEARPRMKARRYFESE